MAKEKSSSFEQKEKKKNINFETLKHVWKKLQYQQNRIPSRQSKISLVERVKDNNGNEYIEIHLSDGGSIKDVGDQKALFQKMMPKKINIGRLLSLLSAVRLFGFNAVAERLSAEMKRALAYLCKKNGIPLAPSQKKKTKHLSSSGISDNKDKNPFAHQRERNANALSAPITSNDALNLAIQQQKKENKRFLDNRLKRCEDEIKEEFFDSLRKELVEIEKRKTENKQLNEAQKTIEKMACFYGIDTDKIKEQTPEQKKHCKELKISSLPAHLQKKSAERINHYKNICNTKNKAIDAVYFRLKHDSCLKNAPINISRKELAEKAASLLPPPAQRDEISLKETEKNIQNQIKKDIQEINDFRKKQKEDVKNILRNNYAHSKSNTSFLKEINKIIIKTKRKSFKQNPTVYNLINKRQLSY